MTLELDRGVVSVDEVHKWYLAVYVDAVEWVELPNTIGMSQHTSTFDGETTVLEAKGRHDPCVVPRAVPIVETMTALVLMDFVLRQSYRTV